MYIVLDESDCERIADVILNSNLKGDYCRLTINVDGVDIDVDYELSVDGYFEDDYTNGTGAWICTNADCKINTIKLSDNENIDIDVNKEYIEREVEEYLTNN